MDGLKPVERGRAAAEETLCIVDTTAIVVGDRGDPKVWRGSLSVVEGRVRFGGDSRRLGHGVRRIDGKGLVVLPGWVNGHTHLYSALARGLLTGGAPPVSFLEILEGLWWKLDRALERDAVRLSGLVGSLEALHSGCTLLFDHHSSPTCIEGSLDLLAEAALKVGLRGSFCYEVSDRDGPAAAEAGIAENLRFAEASSKDTRLLPMFGLHASFTLSDRTLHRCVEAAADAGVGCQIHAAEDQADQEDCTEKHGCRVVERLERAGVLGRRALLAHGVHLAPRELDLLARSGTVLVHNPRSNMNNGVGAAVLKRLGERGVAVCLGTDGMSGHVGEELVVGGLLQRHQRARSYAGYGEIMEAIWAGNHELARRVVPEWRGLAEGAEADLVLLRYDSPTPLESYNVVGHLMFGLAAAPVHSVLVGGKLVLDEGVATGVNEREIRAEARETAARLWSRIK